MAQPPDPAPASPLPPTPRAPRREWLWLALVVTALLAIYLPGMGNMAVFDDAFYTEGQLAARFRELQLRPRMLSYGTFMWIDALFGAGLWKQRVANLLCHVAVVLALFALYRELLRYITPPGPDPGEPVQRYEDSPALGLAIGFFALNPVAVYAVAYLIQRSIVMATFFVVAGLWAFARGLRLRKPWLHALAVACYALALLSKEHAVLAPLAAVPVYILVARPSRRRLALVASAGAILIAIAGGLLAQRFGNILGAPFDEFSRVYLAQLQALSPDAPRNAWGLSILNQAWLFFEYGFRWMLPFGEWMSISVRPPFPLTWLSLPHAIGAVGYLAVVAAGMWLLLRHRDWRALLGLSLLLPASLFATEFATVWVQDPFVLYRSYLWAIGIPGLVLLATHGASARAIIVVGLIAGLLLAWQATERVLSLATPETAWTDAIRKLSKDPRAVGRWFPYLNRGSYYAESDRYELAIRDFETSATLGDMGMGTFNAGSMLIAKGKPQEALRMYDAAEKQGYDLFSLPFQRGVAWAALGKPEQAYRQFDMARAMLPPSPTREILMLERGRMALQTGRREVAISDLQEYLAHYPKHGEARYLLAMAYISKGENQRALEVLDAAGPAPGAPGHYARAVGSFGLGRKADAQREIEAAIRIDPRNPLLRDWQAKIKAMP